MDDPRLDATHLHPPRCDLYSRARAEVFDAMGSATDGFEREVRVRGLPPGCVPLPAKYALRDLRDGRTIPLRIGLNTVGRHPVNDIVLEANPISRRHCVIIVHATGGCEVRDTASRNGVRIDDEVVADADLYPGDMLRLCDYLFELVAEADKERAIESRGL